MKRVLLTTLVMFVFVKITNAVDTNVVKYFPLAVGNKWVYNVSRFLPIPSTWNEVMKITKDTVIDGKRYFLFTGCEAFGGLVRLDSLTGNVLQFENFTSCARRPRERFLDSLAIRLLDTVYRCNVNPYEARVCRDTSYFTLSGINYRAKRLRDVYEIYGTERRYAINLGLVGAVIGDPYSVTYTLKGCVLNGVLYGDTTLLSIIYLSSEIPDCFSLYQNYPNPFNPVTKIKFEIPAFPLSSVGEGPGVRLIIYDVLGREISTLVDEPLQPGTYEVEFDGNTYPSGVYFYRLTSEEFTQTKSMVLIK